MKLEAGPAVQAVVDEIKAELARWRRDPATKPRTIDFLVGMNQRLWKSINYLIRLEPGVQTPEETLVKSSGSCRDSSWLLCQLMRHVVWRRRYVSGYLSPAQAGCEVFGWPQRAEKDFTDLHAW